MRAPWKEAQTLQQALPVAGLVIVRRGAEKEMAQRHRKSAASLSVAFGPKCGRVRWRVMNNFTGLNDLCADAVDFEGLLAFDNELEAAKNEIEKLPTVRSVKL